MIQQLLDLPELQKWMLILFLLIGLIWALRYLHGRAYRLKKFEHARNTDTSPDFLQGTESRRQSIRKAGSTFLRRDQKSDTGDMQFGTSSLLKWITLALACIAVGAFLILRQHQTDQQNTVVIDDSSPLEQDGSDKTREMACEKFPGLC